MSDAAAEGRENLARQKRFLLVMCVVVAAFFALGARVCDTATYSGFLATVARPENALPFLLIVWAWALLTYLQRFYKLFDSVRESIVADVEAEDFRLAHPFARREAKKHLANTDLPQHYGELQVGRRVKIERRQDSTGQPVERLYQHIYGGRMYDRVEYTIRGVNKETAEEWSSNQSFTMTWTPMETRVHRARAWVAALVRRPGLTEHFGPIIAALLTVGVMAYYWNAPPAECRQPPEPRPSQVSKN